MVVRLYFVAIARGKRDVSRFLVFTCKQIQAGLLVQLQYHIVVDLRARSGAASKPRYIATCTLNRSPFCPRAHPLCSKQKS